MILDYRNIWKFHKGEIPVDDKGMSYHIHHLDGDRNNNCIDNLVALCNLSHFYIHYEQGDHMAAAILAKKIKSEIPDGFYSKVKYLAGQAMGNLRSVESLRKKEEKSNPRDLDLIKNEIDVKYRINLVERKLKTRFQGQTKCSLGCCKKCDGKNRNVVKLIDVISEKYKY